MKNLLKFSLVFLTLISLTSCSVQQIPLKGSYMDKPYEITTEKSFDKTWSSIIDLFATKGLSVKLIDKSSGLIVSEKTSFIDSYTFEDRNGNLMNPDAWVVIEKMIFEGINDPIQPEKITGEWNIRIKENDNGKTLINVNLTNINASRFVPGGAYSQPTTYNFNAKSTGEFEKTVASYVK